VARGIFNAAAWICAVVAILVWFLPESAFWGGTESFTLGPVTIELVPDGMLAPIWVRVGAFESVLLAFIMLFFSCRALRILEQILHPMTLGQPFDGSVAPNLKKLAWLCLIGGGIYEIGGLAHQALVLHGRDLAQYFNSAVVKNITVEHELNMWFIAGFVLLMLMSHVFAYGQQLQQLSDETL
jgi:hypothetical protein